MRELLVVSVIGLVAVLTGCPGGGGSAARACASGETACGSACCAAGQACNGSGQCVAGQQLRLYADAPFNADGVVAAAGVTCTHSDWQGCPVTVPAGEAVTVTATPGAGSTFIGFVGIDAAVAGVGTVTMSAGRTVHAWFGLSGAAPACPTMATMPCTHGTFVAGGITRPVTFSGARVVDVDQLSCTYVGGYARPGILCVDAYVCGGVGPYAISLDVGSSPTDGWAISSATTNWSASVLCDGVCTASSQCGANQVCTAGSCVPRPSGGTSDACTQCLDACRGLPGCCTGTGCICDGC